MSGIYIHIPFCKQACHYCDFHFSTSLQNKQSLIDSIKKELILRKNYLLDNKIETIYFGGGTPSLLSSDELLSVFETIHNLFSVAKNAEITLEANPDDLSKAYIKQLRETPVNRLSIGIQSFRDVDLKWMNRAHNSSEATNSVMDAASAGFNNISIDLIYGLPDLSLLDWQNNLKKAIALPVQHLSCYCLTIEPRTALAYQIKKGISKVAEDENAIAQFEWLIDYAAENNFEQYEISNFAKPGFYSRHNTSYWKGIPYLGIGPSAHSFDGASRQWNVSNNPLYIKAVESGKLEFTKEVLTTSEKYNEYVLTSLRTVWGVDLKIVQQHFGEDVLQHLKNEAALYLLKGELKTENSHMYLTRKGKFIADRIASDLFI